MTNEQLESLISALPAATFRVMRAKVRVSLDHGRKQDVMWRLNEKSVEFRSYSAPVDPSRTEKEQVEFLADQNAGMPMARAIVENDGFTVVCELPTVGLTKPEIRFAILQCAREADRMEMALTGEDLL